MFAQVGGEVQLDRSTNNIRTVPRFTRIYDRINCPHGAFGDRSLGVVGPCIVTVVKSLQNPRLQRWRGCSVVDCGLEAGDGVPFAGGRERRSDKGASVDHACGDSAHPDAALTLHSLTRDRTLQCAT